MARVLFSDKRGEDGFGGPIVSTSEMRFMIATKMQLSTFDFRLGGPSAETPRPTTIYFSVATTRQI